jgi:RecA-family ATPase
MATGTGTSGSTGWKAAARAHLYLTRPKNYNDEAEDAEHDVRFLKTMKMNWGSDSGKLKIRWNDGIFEEVSDPTKTAFSPYNKMELDRAIVHAVRYFMNNDQKMAVNPQSPRSYIVKLLKGLPSTKDYEFSALASAVERMANDGRLVKVELGPRSDRALYYRTPDTKYPGEKE